MNHKKDSKKQNGLFIPIRQATAYTSLVISLLGVVFMAGYFLGKQQVVDQFVARIEQDSFADQISASLCSLYDPELLSPDAPQKEESKQSELIVVESETDPELISEYYAQLIGYGTQKAADIFAQSLIEKGIPALVKTRRSQTANGKETVWYQVVTEPFLDKSALEQLTHRIAKSEKIQGIQIVTC
jgi:hypothetical protein